MMMSSIDWILAYASMTIEVLDSRLHGNDGLNDEGRPKFLFGDMISGAIFFSYLFFRSYKEKVHAAKRRNKS